MDVAKNPLNQNATVSLPCPHLSLTTGLDTAAIGLNHTEHVLCSRYETHNQLDCSLVLICIMLV